MSRTHHALVYFFCSASQRGVRRQARLEARPGFDNRADVQDRDDKRGKEGGSETVARPILHVCMKKVKGKKGKERNRYLTLLWIDRMEGFT